MKSRSIVMIILWIAILFVVTRVVKYFVEHRSEFTASGWVFMGATVILICSFVYSVFIYPVEDKRPYQVPEGNIGSQYEWLMKLIEDRTRPLDEKKMELWIKNYENRFIDHPEVMDFVKRLRSALTSRGGFLF